MAADARLVPFQSAEVLRGNTFGILESQGTIEDKIGRLAALVPMALEVVDEARDTIARLREENERLHKELGRYGDEWI